MKTGLPSACRLIVFATAFVGLSASAQIPGEDADPGEEGEPPRCVSEAAIQIGASPDKIAWGQSSVVSWSVSLPAGCSGTHIRLGSESVGRNGSRTVSPPKSRTFTIVVSETRLGHYAETKRSTTLAVTYPERVVIDASTADPLAVLLGALESPNERQTVELCDVEIDLTGHSLPIINDNRSIIASPACARGPRSLGPRIFVTDRRGSQPLFLIRGDNVRFSGFRLQGPTSTIGAGGRKEVGIRIWPWESPAPLHNVEISNMEIFHWSGAAVDVRDNILLAERGRLFNTNEGAVRIRNNFIHHNRHGDGFGYGVNVARGAYALIAQNAFDQNRHAIAGDSRDKKDFSGYTARENLILPGGGRHCSEHWVWAILGWRFNCWQTHQIDMHGDKSTLFGGEFCCGTAGETLIIERNTVLYNAPIRRWAGYAIKIRGNPADKGVIDGNVFRQSRGDAIAQNGSGGFGDNISKPLDVRPNNVFGVANPLTELGSCDFAGGGEQDEFMATGVTWWARSTKSTRQWRYLNTMPERLPQLQLMDVDNDGVCDVAERPPSPDVPPRRYSKSGTGPWVSWNVVIN